MRALHGKVLGKLSTAVKEHFIDYVEREIFSAAETEGGASLHDEALAEYLTSALHSSFRQLLSEIC